MYSREEEQTHRHHRKTHLGERGRKQKVLLMFFDTNIVIPSRLPIIIPKETASFCKN